MRQLWRSVRSRRVRQKHTILFELSHILQTHLRCLLLSHCQVLNFFREQTGMSERTLRLHKDLIMVRECSMIDYFALNTQFKALTVHAMIPPIYFIVTLLYAIMFFGIYRRAAMEKAMFLVCVFFRTLRNIN